MRLHYLQHVPFENIANIQVWARDRGHTVTKTVLYYDESLPDLKSFDWLIVMGGPMNIYEEKDYPWLAREKKFIREAIDAGKIVLGVCLGAQMIADVLGAKVTQNKVREIGWYEVGKTPEGKASPVFKALPDKFMAFHWHGDTFGIPGGARRLACSEACENQAFEANNGKVVGLQFHLESSDDSINRLTKNCGDDLTDGKYIQKKTQLVGQDEKLKQIYSHMCALLDAMEKAGKS